MRSLILLILAQALIALPASAADTDGQYTILGVGGESCAVYLNHRHGGNDLADLSYRNWLGGYLTHYNRTVAGTYNILGGTDLNGAMLWLENYCKANPTDSFSIAADKLIEALGPKRQTTKP
jgi:hypothetical protein